jgi:hypothetical protein
MTKIEEIEKEIEALPEVDFKKLREWFSKKDWNKWDQEIEADANSGKLNFLVKEVEDAKNYGKLKNI